VPLPLPGKNSFMQKYENISELSPTKFKRLTGVRKDTFIERISIVKEAENKRMSRGGKPPYLGIEDRLLTIGIANG
jgi:hypothetical protein